LGSDTFYKNNDQNISEMKKI